MAGAAGSAVVGALAGDTWQQAVDGVIALWRRFRPENVDAVGRDLESARSTLLLAGDGPEADRTAEALRVAWQGQLMTVLLSDPSAVRELRVLLDELSPPGTPGAEVHLRAKATGHGRVYQAGRDQHITEG
ncbi:hypothetical protein [Streptomyces sp. NPDC046853]|uniref:hypothetical protein n=1 Tax=unclassified Streptomyces TaxID=2593676 RepID=UPI0033CC0A56